MITTVKPYAILLNWLNDDHDIQSLVGARLWYGGVPVEEQQTLPARAINIFGVGGEPDVSLMLDRTDFQVQCIGGDMGEAWDVYTALRGTLSDNQRIFNRMVATPEGETYMFALQETSPGMDVYEPDTNWPCVVSRWRLTSWKQTKGG